MPVARTLYERIVDTHTVKRIDEDTVLLYVDAHFANECTSPQAFSDVRERGCGVFSPESHLCVVDHIIPSADVSPRVIHDAASALQASNQEKNCRDFGIEAFYGPNDAAQGIEYVLMDEQGLVRPGVTVICGDSHTTTHGPRGAGLGHRHLGNRTHSGHADAGLSPGQAHAHPYRGKVPRGQNGQGSGDDGPAQNHRARGSGGRGGIPRRGR